MTKMNEVIYMRKIYILAIIFAIAGLTTFYYLNTVKFGNNSEVSFNKTPTPTVKPLLKYTYENLQKYKPESSEIVIDEELEGEEDFVSHLFFFNTSGGKKVSGLLNIPSKKGEYPVVILFRGFVDPAIYETGIGSQRVGEYFASNGFITLAPDFLGYGSSDKPVDDAFEDRFMTYTTVIDLVSSIKNINAAFSDKEIYEITADYEKLAFWGHSNGGQIALSVAEITGHKYPTVVWAPVSKPFPYSILYYTDEFDDNGKALRRALAKFEENYDVEKYSPANFYDLIKAPIQIHQGVADEEVPVVWSDELEKILKDKKVNVEYFTYPGENHNFQNGSWPLAVSRSAEFIKKNIGK